MFKSLEIKKSSLEKLVGERGELYKSDVEGQLKGLPPGEWILLRDPHRKRVFLGFANPLVEDKIPAIRVLKRLKEAPKEDTVAEYLTEMLAKAWVRRSSFDGYENGSRAIFGDADGLPGLIVDVYVDCALVQINTAGIDRHRTFLKEQLENLIGKKCFFLDQPAQRGKEVLPHYREEFPFTEINVLENEFKYQIPTKNLQKIGWYYDHRENRSKFENALKRWRGKRARGVDLFCYGGAWGLHALRAGVEHVDFVDQAPLLEMVNNHISINGFDKRGTFHRSDVFDWLDQQIALKAEFDVIVSDPPAFAKSSKERAGAIEGYRKLHRKVLKLASANSLVAFASCTHYVEHEAFVETIVHASHAENRKIQILEVGMQGWDHPVSSLDDRSNYIKYTLVRVE